MPNTSQAAAVVSTGALDLILQAGPVVKLVLLILVALSLLSWAIIYTKLRLIKSATKQNGQFLTTFWQGKNLDEISDAVEAYDHSPLASTFKAGFKELKKLSKSERTVEGAVETENVHRALRRASHAEVAALEKNLSWLATIASAAPFIGLFGTVWGIMNAFQNIGSTGAANLAVVAPGISEALIATAIGLGAAIPAVIFYNHFIGRIKRIIVDMDCFVQDFLNIVQRSFMTGKKS